MDTVRKIAIGIVMIIPAFVLGGLVWEWVPSWPAVLVLEIVMIGIYIRIISGKSTEAPAH